MKTEDIKKMGLAYLSVIEAASKKEDNSNDKSDDGDGMDKVQPKAVKKKFDDRKDKDIDNDGDTDSSDEFLHKKRKAISKAMDKEEPKSEGKRGFIMAAKAAKANGDKTFVFAGKKYNCEEALGGKFESLDWLTHMDEDEFDTLIEGATPEQLDEIIGTLKKVATGGANVVKKVANRFSTAGRADAADKKLAKAKKKIADKDRLNKAKAGLAALKKKPETKTEHDDGDPDNGEHDAPANDADPKKKKKVAEPADDEVKEAKEITYRVGDKKQHGNMGAKDLKDLMAKLKAAKFDMKSLEIYDKDAKKQIMQKGKMVEATEEVCEACGKVHEGDCDPADVKEFKLKKEMKKKEKLKADDENPADDDSKDDDEVEEGKRGFVLAAKAAKEKGEKSFVFAGKKYNCEDMKEIKKESYSFDELVDMSDEDFDDLAERIERKEMDEIVGTIARGIGRTAKKVVNRFSTSGRADAAQKKLGKMKKKAADKDRLSKAKADIAALKNKGKKPAPKPMSAEKEPEKKMKKFNEVRENATKGATKPEGIMDKESPKSKEFAAKHKKEVNDTEEKGHKDAVDAGRKGPAGKKRPGDNPKGDKAIVNKPTQKEGVQNGMRQALMQMKGE